MKSVCIFPGISETILNALKTKLSSMPADARLCSLAFDEMSLKERVVYSPSRDEVEGFEDLGADEKGQYVANHATGFMLRGIQAKWKQAIGYVLSSGPINSDVLHSLLLQTIDKVESAGISVKVIIADQGSNNRRVFETLCRASVDKPFFEHKGKRYLVMYDPPHLLKNVRNNLKKSGFIDGDQNISWAYIEQLYKMDLQNPIRLAPKLSKTHIELPMFSNMSVKLAAQVLSHTVAAGISTMAQLNALPEDAVHTAKFIDKMDQLFNAFNSGTKGSTQPMRHAMTETSGHREFLLETRSWLQSLISLSQRPLPCLSGWMLDINALLALWQDLHDNHGAKLLFTSRLNQDHVENLFSVIRGKHGHNFHPDAQQFRTALRATMVDALIDHSKGSNCSVDMDTFLLNLELLSNTTTVTPETAIDERQQEAADREQQEENRRLEEESEMLWKIATPGPLPVSPLPQQIHDNVICYIAGYIARKLRFQVCDGCSSRLTRTNQPSATSELFIANKQYEGAKEGLLTPSHELFQTVQCLERVYMANAALILHKYNVKKKLVSLCEESAQTTFRCALEKPCALQDRLCGLFINIRLHFTLKDNSRSFSSCSGKRNRKMVNLSHQ